MTVSVATRADALMTLHARIAADLMVPSAKEIGAIVAWIFFAILLQSFISGAYHARRTIFFSAGAFVSIIVAILGIAHG